MKSLAIMQPVYMPWLGYFEQIAVCDEFMFFDNVQYTRRDWRNRNKIRTLTGWQWLIIPVKREGLDTIINDAKIDYGTNWQRKHMAAIKNNYSKSPYFEDIFEILRPYYERRYIHLIDITIPLIKDLAAYLQLGGNYSYASDYPNREEKSADRVIALCHARDAKIAYTGPRAKNYTSVEYFKQQGIDFIFQDYQHPIYKQRGKGFESHMSIIDLLMNYGPDSREILLSSPPPIFYKSK